MAEFAVKYADPRGEIHNQIAEGASDTDVRERLTAQGFLVYSVKARGGTMAALGGRTGGRGGKLNLEKFLIFNQQFVTLIKAGLPILKGLDLLADRLVDPKLKPFINNVRDEVRHGSLLSDAFEKQGIFPPVYVTSVLAGEKSGALAEVLERFVTYQKTALAIRKRVLVSLIYPAFLTVLVFGLIVFLVTYVVPNFAQLYGNAANLPQMTQILIAVGTTARDYLLFAFGALIAAAVGFRFWSRTEAAQLRIDAVKLKMPVFGEIWIKYQVAQFSRVLSTLLQGGIPLVQALGTASASLGTPLLTQALEQAVKMVREGQPLSSSLASTEIFPELSIDMIEVGESTGALPSMLSSVADFYEDDVATRMQAALSMIEPAIMIFMGIFVAFVLIALYLPIFSLSDSIGG